MRRASVGLELPVVLLALVFVEMGEVLRELRTDVVLDWFVSLAPLIWVDVSVIVLYAFLRLYFRATPRIPSEGGRWSRLRTFLLPDFARVRAMGKGFRRVWVAAAMAYGVAFMLLQGILVVDPSSTIEPTSTVLESPVGYGPGVAWAPTPTFGIVLRPYSVAALVTLSVLSGLVIAVSVRLFTRSRRAATAASGPLLGFAVMCPACVGAPLSGLFLAYAAPFASMGGMGAASAFSWMLAVSTGLLIITVLLLWVVLALLSNTVLAGTSGGTNPAGPTGPRLTR